jgi:hypothetical protein
MQARMLIYSLLLCVYGSLNAQIPPIGQWREHLNYQQAIQVVKGGNRIFCATSSALFSLNTSLDVQRYSKITGLNEVGINTIGWDEQGNQLLIAYTNSNMDVLKDGIVHNIGDIQRSTLPGDKTIFRIFTANGLAYISTGLGIVVADLTKYEIKDSWIIGNNGSKTRVFDFASTTNAYFAATEEGLKTCLRNNNPADYRNWNLLSNSSNLPAGSCEQVAIFNNEILVRKNDSLFLRNGQNWQLWYTDAAWPITATNVSGNKVLVSQRTPGGAARVIVLNANGGIDQIITQNGVISFPRSALQDGNYTWVADQFGGLSRFGNGTERFIPNGPPGTATGEMVSNGKHLYATAGSINEAWNYLFNREGVFDFSNEQWSYQGYFNKPVLDSVLDFITVTIDPRNEQVWAGSYGGGLVRFNNQQITIFKSANSSLRPAIGDPGSIRVSGLAFDSKQQLWVSNYGAAQNLSVRKTDSSWKSFSIPFTHLENAVAQIVVDDLDQLWIQSPKGNGLFCYNPGNNIDLLNDDQWKYYRQGAGLGNLPSNNVYSLVKDKNGYIWVGTDRGIGIIQCPENVFGQGGCEAIQPIVQQDRFAGLLFKDERVQSMAVDGANRKWVGTKNGVWLISPNGDKIIYRFTAENSPLLSNDVRKITIDPLTGEVFIATLNGICSFRSTATEGGSKNQDVQVFPNPVPPGYNGTIAIRGLVNNALVKITELNGRLVFQTRALGGQAVWDGRHYTGTKAASGIYLVIVRDDSGAERMVTKLIITQGR